MIALLLAVPTLAFQLLAIDEGDARISCVRGRSAPRCTRSTIGYLLRYVFQREVMTADKLYGAAAAYLMLGVLWGYLYAIAEPSPARARSRSAGPSDRPGSANCSISASPS